MKKYLTRTLDDCIIKINNYSENIEYSNIEGDLIATLNFLKDYRKLINIKLNQEKKETISIWFKEIWNLYPKGYKKGKVSDTQKSKLYKIGKEKILISLQNYKKDIDLKINGGFKTIMNASTFFNGRYNDYLPEENTKTTQYSKLKFTESDI